MMVIYKHEKKQIINEVGEVGKMIDVKNVSELLKYKESLEKDLEHKQIDNNTEQKEISWGDIYWVNLGMGVGSEQGSNEYGRPCMIIQNNTGNKFSPTVIVAIITSKMSKADIPTHVKIEGCGLNKPSEILLEQIRTVDKKRIRGYIGHVNDIISKKVQKALEISQKQQLSPIDRIKNDEIRKVIEIKLKNIEGYERVLFTTKSKGSKFYNMCLEERLIWLSDLESYCKKNGLNFKDYYKAFEGEVDLEILSENVM